ncbi:MAG: hypothetical protein GEU96_09245 [Propionibacteriales bacterium]|nr:hypothetical protein [Propionibacteriales bacterium]
MARERRSGRRLRKPRRRPAAAWRPLGRRGCRGTGRRPAPRAGGTSRRCVAGGRPPRGSGRGCRPGPGRPAVARRSSTALSCDIHVRL